MPVSLAEAQPPGLEFLVERLERHARAARGAFNEQRCIALYDRAVGKLENIAIPRLMACRAEFAAILNDLDIAIA